MITTEEIALQIEESASYEQLQNPIIFASLVAIKFAKLHCIEQAKVISEKAVLNIDGIAEINNGQQYVVDSGQHYSETEIRIDKSSILNAYDLNNIK